MRRGTMMMSTTVRLSSLLFVWFNWAGSANEGTLAFVGATIIDGTAAAPINGVLVISDGRVRSVGSRSASPCLMMQKSSALR